MFVKKRLVFFESYVAKAVYRKIITQPFPDNTRYAPCSICFYSPVHTTSQNISVWEPFQIIQKCVILNIIKKMHLNGLKVRINFLTVLSQPMFHLTHLLELFFEYRAGQFSAFVSTPVSNISFMPFSESPALIFIFCIAICYIFYHL